MIAYHEERWTAQDGREDALLWEDLYQVVDLGSIDTRMDVFEVCNDGDCRTSIFDLENVHEALVEILVVQNQEDDSCFLLFIQHC